MIGYNLIKCFNHKETGMRLYLWNVGQYNYELSSLAKGFYVRYDDQDLDFVLEDIKKYINP